MKTEKFTDISELKAMGRDVLGWDDFGEQFVVVYRNIKKEIVTSVTGKPNRSITHFTELPENKPEL